MEDEGVIPKSLEILKSNNVDEDLGYISEEEISETFTWLNITDGQAHPIR